MSPTPNRLHYCPECGVKSEKDAPLCAYCGAKRVVGGYCPICEAPLPRPVGTYCPKHEVELLDPDDEALEVTDEVETAVLVTVRCFNSSVEANAARLRLEAEGIPTFLDAERMGSGAFYSVATGGMKLRVPLSLEADARILLSQSWAPIEDQADELADAWEELAPEPWEKRRQVMKVLILVLLFGPTLLFVAGGLLLRRFGG